MRKPLKGRECIVEIRHSNGRPFKRWRVLRDNMKIAEDRPLRPVRSITQFLGYEVLDHTMTIHASVANRRGFIEV